MATYPAELQALQQWVCWRRTQRQGKTTKIPLHPCTGANARTDDPTTWGAFEEALAGIQRFRCTGIGFVFTAADAYFGVDLDTCIDLATGEIAAWAQDIIDRLASFTELSQSQTGVHIIGKGTLPLGRRRHGQIEMYDRGRFFVMTGHPVPGMPTTIEARQREIEALHQDLFPPGVHQHYALIVPMPPLCPSLTRRCWRACSRPATALTSGACGRGIPQTIPATARLTWHCVAIWRSGVGAMWHISMRCFGSLGCTARKNGTGRTTVSAP